MENQIRRIMWEGREAEKWPNFCKQYQRVYAKAFRADWKGGEPSISLSPFASVI